MSKPTIYKNNEKNFLEQLKKSLKDPLIKKILIRGYSWQLNFLTVLAALRETNLTKGLLTTTDPENIPNLFESAGIYHVKPHGMMPIPVRMVLMSFDKFSNKHHDNANMQFQILFPVEYWLTKEKGVLMLQETLYYSNFMKTIAITTSDYNTNPEELYPYVDEVHILDISDNNNKIDNKILKDKYADLAANFKSHGEQMPY